MGLTEEQKKERANLTRDIRTFDSKEDKDYVFISYKSDDWKNVLGKVVKPMVDNYGLRVYFDKNFEHDNDSWVNNMRNAIETGKCQAVLAFISKKYMVSYACMMELLTTLSNKTYLKHDQGKYGKLQIIPIIVDESRSIKEAASKSGKEVFIEEESYCELLEDVLECSWLCVNKELEKMVKYLQELTKRRKNLKEEDVSIVVKMILTEKYERKLGRDESLPDFYDKLKKTIMSCCQDGDSVFDTDLIKKMPLATDCIDVKAAGTANLETKNTHVSKLEYWKGFCDYVEREDSGSVLRMSKTADRNWHAIHLDKSIFSIECSVNTQKDCLRTAFIIQDRPEVFRRAEQEKRKIDRELKELGIITWDGKARAAKVFVITSRTGMKVEEQYEWFWHAAKIMYETIRPCLDAQ